MSGRAITLAIVSLLVALIAAAALGWWFGQPEPVVETRAPEQRQADGSVVLERQPDAQAKANQEIPHGAKLERMGRVTVQPAPKPGLQSKPSQENPCDPVTVDWSLVREPDGGRRFLASSPDGTIIGGVDVPVESAAPSAEPKRWAAGISWVPTRDTYGVWIERDAPLFATAVRVGVDINQVRTGSDTGVDARLRIGVAF